MVEKLKSCKEQANKLLPIETLLSQRSQLEGDLVQIQEQFTLLKSQIQQAQTSLSQTESKRIKEEESFQEKHIELVGLKSDIEQFRKKYPYTRATLEFMLALPQAATAPLWVEVLRLALQQGEMDELSKQALERLAIPHPDDAIPLLAEIAARAPEPFKIELKQAQKVITQWFLLIARARLEIQAEKPLKAAETMVRAWETFFALKANN